MLFLLAAQLLKRAVEAAEEAAVEAEAQTPHPEERPQSKSTRTRAQRSAQSFLVSLLHVVALPTKSFSSLWSARLLRLSV